MKWIGLTGGIATGKSAVKNILLKLNQSVIDADEISHQLTQPGQPGYRAIVSHFGKDFLNPDLSIHRKALGEQVFKNKDVRLQLEAILHPLIQDEVKNRRLQLSSQQKKICFYDVPLLFEKNLTAQFDKTVIVYAPLLQQIDRLMLRNQLTHNQALDRIRAQVPLADKVFKADYCLDNSTDLADLEIQVQLLIHQLFDDLVVS